MSSQQPISIKILQEALEAKEARIRALEAEVDAVEAEACDLRLAIRKLQAEDGNGVINGQTAAALIEAQERAVENDLVFPAANFIGKSRNEIAVALAKSFDGYLAPIALRKVLSKPGVLKSISQVGSVASRVLANSDDFMRAWGGLYRLKEYNSDIKQNAVSTEAAEGQQ